MHASVDFVKGEFFLPAKDNRAAHPWPPEERFWDRLQRLRDAMGVDNATIAQVAGVAIGTVSNWKNRRPDTDALLKLARYFNVTPEWLLNGADVLTARDKPAKPPRGR